MIGDSSALVQQQILEELRRITTLLIKIANNTRPSGEKPIEVNPNQFIGR